MKPALQILLLVFLFLVPSETRAEGIYLHEGVGHSQITLADTKLDGSTISIGLGYNFGSWALEGSTWLNQVNSNPGEAAIYALSRFALDAKYYIPLASHIKLYVRGGIGHISYGEYEGRTLQYGSGIQASIDVPALGFLFFPLFFTDLGPKVQLTAYVDLNKTIFRGHSRYNSQDGTIQSTTFGIAVGGSF